MRKLLIAALMVTGCATDTAGSVEFIDGFSPDAPGPNAIQFVIPPIRGIEPGADKTFCTYLDYRSDREVDIYDYTGFQSKAGAHHALLYAVENNAPSDTHICNEDDMINARYLAGGGADAPPQYLPEGVVIRMPANTQLMIQTHWINASDVPVDGQAAFNVSVEDPSPSHVNAQLFTAVNTMFTLPLGISSVHTACTVQQELNFFLMGGHAHEHGTHIKLTITPATAAASIIYDTAWNTDYQFNPPRNYYTKDAPFTMHPGDTIRVDCDFNNSTPSPISFPQEMCVGWGYFFPAVNEIDCTDGIWPT